MSSSRALLELALCHFCRIENLNFHVGQWLGSERPDYPHLHEDVQP
jgi:hypothetical protein